MLVITDAQLTAPIADETGFVGWFVDSFMPEFLDEFHDTIDRNTLIKRARYGRDKAISFGFKDPISHTHFVLCLWEIGPDFFTFEGFKEIVEDTKTPEKQRIDAFYEVPEAQDIAARLNSHWNKTWLTVDSQP